MSLPSLFESLGKDAVESLPGIQRHQADGFHVFLCYLAVVVLTRLGDEDCVQPAEYWRRGLRHVSDERDEPWTLIVTDLSQPAFLQPPIPAEDQDRMQRKAQTPDELDLLVTAKDHDVKIRRASHAPVDTWIYALVNLQTMGGFSGRGQMGIARMNSGFGNRLIVEVARSFRPGVRWRDGVSRALKIRQNLLQAEYGYQDTGIALTWMLPWDGKTSLNMSQLDPFFIEICRRVRLQHAADGNLVADGLSSDGPRIYAKPLLGVLGDPWLPVELSKESPKALTISGRGLTPDILTRLMFQENLRLSAVQQPDKSWRDTCWMTASVLVRGQGKTDGFYEQCIRIPPQALPRVFGTRQEREPLAALARTGIEAAGKMRKSVLKVAVFSLLEGGPDKIKRDDSIVEAWWSHVSEDFEQRWSSRYFAWLWRAAEADTEEARDRARLEWVHHLCQMALTSLSVAEKRLPQHHGRHYRAITEAHRTFYRMLYNKNNFPNLKEGETDDTSRRVSS